MIKFRCPNCGQKIAVNDEGAGVVISCTTCTEYIMVPFETQTEFQQQPSVPCTAQPVSLELVPAAPEERAEQPPAQLREALMPHLARLMMNKLVSALFSQRAHLMKTQDDSTVRVTELEQRLLKVHEQLQARIAELERELARQKDENRDLVRAKVLLTRKAMEAEQRMHRSPVDLRDAGFLLRA